MSLPILPSHRAATTADLVRLYQRTELQWVRQAAEETPLECGSAFTNPLLPKIYDSNCMLQASIPEGSTAAAAVAEADAFFTSRGARCFKWMLNTAVPPPRTQPLAEHLLSLGFTAETYDLMYLGGRPTRAIDEAAGLQIIPGRASFRHARELFQESAARWNEPQVVEAAMLHVEDPQTDSLLALKDGSAAGLVLVLIDGELGCIEDLYVAERFRRQGVGRTLMSRALEICARSLLKHVFVNVDPTNAPAAALYERCGFRRLAPYVLHRAPQARP
ncbi:MAG TPA: GNAT family N-acetyltransferase [Tepidisphaeraceae bacterium]|nr:GNAT family N-acetyltransferase [Tepidisphaeraceae bacterium]